MRRVKKTVMFDGLRKVLRIVDKYPKSPWEEVHDLLWGEVEKGLGISYSVFWTGYENEWIGGVK